MILAATGHRPEKLGGYDPRTRYALGGLAVEALHELRPDKVISGMALGWDQAVAGAAVALGIPFVAAVPWRGQADRWPDVAKRRWERLLERAAEVVYVVEDSPTINVNRALILRNGWMANQADRMLALWDGTPGGTWNCLSYALAIGKPVTNVWPYWTMDDVGRELVG